KRICSFVVFTCATAGTTKPHTTRTTQSTRLIFAPEFSKAAKLAEGRVIPGLLLVPHWRRLKVSRTRLQVPLYLILVQRNPQPRPLWNLDIALVDDRLLDPRDQVLPERHIERVIFEREKIPCRRCAMHIGHAAHRSPRKVHRHRNTVAKCHVANLVR